METVVTVVVAVVTVVQKSTASLLARPRPSLLTGGLRRACVCCNSRQVTPIPELLAQKPGLLR